MSKKIFTEQEILELSKNKYVKNVTAKGITYTNEFKLQFIAEYENGKTSRAIFEDAGFDVNIIGIKRIDSASLRWRKAYNDKGILGLEDTRTLNSGRTLNRELTIEEIIAKKDAEIEYLKAELELIKKLELQERQVIGDAVYMIHFNRLSKEGVEGKEGIEAGDYVGNVQLGGRDLPDHFTAELVLGAGEMRQTVSFDVQTDQKPIIKPSKSVTISDGIQASVDALKIAESGAYIHVTWEFSESQKALYDEMTNEESLILFMALDDSNGNHFTTEENMDDRQTIVNTVDGSDWSGAEPIKYYEADGKYYVEMYGLINGMNENLSSLTVTPYARTGAEDGVP